MFLIVFFSLLAFSCFIALTRDIGAVSLVLLIGFLQDPARKVMSGEPVVMTIMAGIVLSCVALRLFLASREKFFEPFSRWTDSLVTPLTVFLVIVGLQGLHSFIRYDSPIVTALGAIFYVAPLVAIAVGYSQFQRFFQLRNFLTAYVAFALIAALTVIIEFSGVISPLLGEVGSGLVIYDQGTVLKAYSGLLRSSEIASWHMGVCVCFILILIADRNSTASWVLAALIITLLMGAIVLTGRRKMIVQVIIFTAIYIPVLRYYQGRISTRFVAVILFGFTILTVVYTFVPSFEGTDYDLYLARGATVFGDAGERFTTLGFGSVGWAFQQFGFLGGGLGVASQGSQHFISSVMTGAGEGGVGKLVAELGFAALFIVFWLAISIALFLHRCLLLVANTVPERLALVVGVAVALTANLPTFIVASQLYGDVFVLLILGLLTGSLFAIPAQTSFQIKYQTTAQPSWA